MLAHFVGDAGLERRTGSAKDEFGRHEGQDSEEIGFAESILRSASRKSHSPNRPHYRYGVRDYGCDAP